MRYLLVALLLVGCGSVDPADVPPAGDIWFGSSFDAETFELAGRSETFGADEPVAMIASLPRSVSADDIGMRWYYDGSLVGNTDSSATGSGDVWGWTLGPHFAAGRWRYEITDIGGNVLASGEFTTTE